MGPRIDVIGIGADGAAGLRPDLVERVLAADFLAGGERHLGYFPAARGQRFVLQNNVAELLTELRQRLGKERCVVLASGDPMFNGIGIIVADRFDRDRVRVEPAVSSMQLAFARAGWPWEMAALGSVHGRDLRANLLPLLSRDLIGLCTHDGDSPAAVARFFLGHGVPAFEAVVGENLGGPDERVTHWPDLHQLAEQHFAPLNYLLLHRTEWPAEDIDVIHCRNLVPGVPDDAFARPESGPEVMTRQEVRAVVLAKLLGPTSAGDTVWDVGAGLGTVSVEVAVLRGDVEVVAVERDPARVALLRANRDRFGAYNIRVVEGSAPEALHDETERPRLVFVGGSGGRLSEILDLIAERLLDGGRLVAAFVTLEHLLTALERVKGWGWPWEVTEVQVARSDALAGLTGLRPQRGVFVLRLRGNREEVSVMSDTARQLVEKVAAAGEWPEPQLLEEVLAQGEAAVEPLREVVRREIHGWPEEAPLCFAIDLLGSLGAVSAIPDLLALFRRYDNETLQSASTTLGVFGAAAFDALLDVIRSPDLNPYQRTEASTAAILAAGADERLLERLAAALRELLAAHVTRADRLTDEEAEMASFLVSDLTQLADPQARGLIDAAFKAGIVDAMLINPGDVDHYYRRGRAEVLRPEPRAWLEEYKDLYEEELRAREELKNRPPEPEDEYEDDDEDEEPDDEDDDDVEWEPPPRTLPFERSGPRVGRNDPCPCGSGKKYKNCHLKLDRR